MLDKDCLFCKIIKKEIPSKIIAENDYVLVIEDISPKAPIHYLIIPKKHIKNLHHITDEDSKISYEMLKIAKDIAQEIKNKNNLKNNLAFNLITNNEAGAGQSVFHMHWHFLSGKNLSIDGSSL